MNKYQARQLPLTLAVSSVLATGSLQAATITIDTANDGPVGTFPTECTLRAAIAAANTDTAVDACVSGESGLDQIVFDASLDQSVITIATLDSPFLISDSVSISGPSAGAYESIFINGGSQSRVFEIAGSEPGSIDVSMDSLTIERGYIGFEGDNQRGGGVVSNNTNLTLTDARVTNNYDYYGNGGIGFANGTLVLNDTVISNNLVGYSSSGGGIGIAEGTLVVNGGSIRNNIGYTGGGGVHLGANTTASFNGTQVSNNLGLSNFSYSGAGISAESSNLTISNSEISDNSFASGGYGGGISAVNSQVTVIDSGILDNSLGYYMFGFQDGAGIRLVNSTLTMQGSAVTGNRINSYYAAGAGISGSSSTIDISNSLISENDLTASAAFDSFDGGGALLLVGGQTTIRDSEISLNRMFGDFQRASVGRFINPDISFTNVTISGNELFNGSMLSPGAAAAIALEGTGSVEFVHVTMDDNVDLNPSSVAVVRAATASLVLTNTVISGPAGTELCNVPASTVTSSLATDASCTGTATDTADLALGALANNGGPTRTQSLGAGSLAIDAGGDCANVLGVLTDQRGFPRDSSCDLGAFEFVDSIFLDRFEG